MALIVKDRIKETTTTTGTGTVTLSGAAAGFQSFSAVGDTNTTYYAIVSGNDWEVGLGTYTASGTTLSRDTILESSNGGSAITLAGTSTVFCTYPAEKAVVLDANNQLVLSEDVIINGLTVGKGANSVASNTALGVTALSANTTGNTNTAIGGSALNSNTTANGNVGVGYQTLYSNVTGNANVAVGPEALWENLGNANTALGAYALYSNTTGVSNIAIGSDALGYIATGSYNTSLGTDSGTNLENGSNNIFIGYNAQPSSATVSNEVTIGDDNITVTRLKGSVTAPSLGIGTAASGTTGEIRATNNVTAYYSDDRLKTRGSNIENALDKVASLNGFHYQANDVANALGYVSKPEVGVSAQEVQAVLPEVVVPAPIDDKYLTVHYDKLVPLLIEAIKELKTEVDELKNRIK